MKINTSAIQDINFFDSPTACISDYESSPWIMKVISFIKSIDTLFLYAFDKLSLTLRRVESQMEPLIDLNIGSLSKTRLVVCMHGLNNGPIQFKKNN